MVDYKERHGGANYRLKFGAQESNKDKNGLYLKKQYMGQRKHQEIPEHLIEVLDYAPETAPKHDSVEPLKKGKAHPPDRKKVWTKRRLDLIKEK